MFCAVFFVQFGVESGSVEPKMRAFAVHSEFSQTCVSRSVKKLQLCEGAEPMKRFLNRRLVEIRGLSVVEDNGLPNRSPCVRSARGVAGLICRRRESRRMTCAGIIAAIV